MVCMTRKNGATRSTGSCLPPTKKSLTGSSAKARANIELVAPTSAGVTLRTMTGRSVTRRFCSAHVASVTAANPPESATSRTLDRPVKIVMSTTPPSRETPNMDHGFRPGSARAALAYPDFRRMWARSFASNIGTWMQNVVLPAYVYERTGKASVVGLLVFAQLGPLLLLSIPAGVIADRFDR